jgi:toxin ParE1/3/4
MKTYRLLTLKEVTLDLQVIYGYYSEISERLADDFVSEIRNSFFILEKYPFISTYYHKDFRRIIVNRFPYKIFYKVKNDVVYVYGILHEKQHRHSISKVLKKRRQ